MTLTEAQQFIARLQTENACLAEACGGAEVELRWIVHGMRRKGERYEAALQQVRAALEMVGKAKEMRRVKGETHGEE